MDIILCKLRKNVKMYLSFLINFIFCTIACWEVVALQRGEVVFW